MNLRGRSTCLFWSKFSMEMYFFSKINTQFMKTITLKELKHLRIDNSLCIRNRFSSSFFDAENVWWLSTDSKVIFQHVLQSWRIIYHMTQMFNHLNKTQTFYSSPRLFIFNQRGCLPIVWRGSQILHTSYQTDHHT